jgi:hypothetical protein
MVRLSGPGLGWFLPGPGQVATSWLSTRTIWRVSTGT